VKTAAPVVSVTIAISLVLSGCSGQQTAATSTPLTAADRAFLDGIRLTGAFHVTAADERSWIQIGQNVCSGLKAKGTAKYMAETGARQYRQY
jgi:uncharacterized lipoprotein YajG